MTTAPVYEYVDPVSEAIAAFTVAAPDSLSDDLAESAMRAMGDSVAVALGALTFPAAVYGRKYAALMPVPDGVHIWGSTLRSTPDVAALINGVLLRCYDYNDFFVGDRNSGHPSDMVSGILAAAEHYGISGERTLAALAAGYEGVGAAYDCFSTAPGGWDYTNLSGIGSCIGIAKLLGLDHAQAREAIGIVVTNHLATDEVESCELNRRGDLTMWKRYNGSDSVRNALQACMLASVGVEGSVRPFVGNQGFIKHLINDPSFADDAVKRFAPGQPLTVIQKAYFKPWPTGSQAQSTIRAVLEAREKISSIDDIKQMRVYCEEGAYEHFVTMRQDAWNPISRETADHSMPYVAAAALFDGYIKIDSYDLDKVNDPVRRAFMANKMTVDPDPSLGRISDGKLSRAERGYLGRVEIEMNDGTVIEGPAKPFPGHPASPFTRAELESKFRDNMDYVPDEERKAAIIEKMFDFRNLDNVGDFTRLLAFDR